MAVTHADLEPSRGKTDLSSKTCALFLVLPILLGLSCFILCLIAEATHSQVTWMSTAENGKGSKSECFYSGNGKMPLICASCAFIVLAIVMLLEHTYMLIAVSNSSTTILNWDPDSARFRSLTWQAAFFFITTWICFAVGEIVLLAGMSVESGHLKNWSEPKTTCLAIREGVFCAAGVFALTTVFLASGLYLTALRAQRILQEFQNVGREVLHNSAMHASPPSPRFPTATTRENPTPFSKSYDFV